MIVLGQPSIVRMESKLRYMNTPPQNTIGYMVTNTTADTIYIWIQQKQEIFNRTDSFRKYFFSRLGDFSLSMLCFDGNIVFKDEFVPILGHNFIKKLCPNESFRIYSVCSEMDLSAIQWESIKNVKMIVPPHKLDEYDFGYEYIIIDPAEF